MASTALLVSLSALSRVASPLHASAVTAHALRLLPGDDLVHGILGHCKAHDVSAAAVLSCVGSLSCATLRLAGAEEIIELDEELEIVSLVGTVGRLGEEHHLHMSVSRRDGSVLGGHCKGKFLVRTTAELVIGVLPKLVFERALDSSTGYKELQVFDREADKARD
jgi:predicted DNA-binding protein with PD1-like motif